MASMHQPSFWLERLGPRPMRPAVASDLEVDVCVLGAGYTGLWTAYYLAKADPSLRIAVVESEQVGFGASGRNGGWASAKIAGNDRLLADPERRSGAVAIYREMIRTLGEMGRVIAAESIDCGFTLGGSVVAATRPGQVGRLKDSVALEHAAGFDDGDLRWMEPDEARRVIATSRSFGATFTPHCAAVDPARLVVGLAAAAERAGVAVYEQSPGTPVPGGVRTPGGRVRAAVVVEAIEAYRTSLRGRRRDVIPVYSLMVVTEPVPAAAWNEIGLAGRETFSDGRHLIIYGQRTEDGRIAFGGRGAPYHYGSAVEPGFDHDERTFTFLRDTLVELFPVLRGVRFEGAWGGPLAIPRDWQPSIRFDGSTAIVGGYVGQGVALANLAGRTVRDLVLRADTDIVRLPWVGHHSPRWEPEPLRWIGVNLARRLTDSVDRAEERGRAARIRRAIFDRLPVG
ncbi:MAG: FAD-binding oxidoreductase [Actinomycetota bacterium]